MKNPEYFSGAPVTATTNSLWWKSVIVAFLLTSALLYFCPFSSHAALLTWDSSGANPGSPVPGAGTWSSTNANWSNGATDVVWNNANNDDAQFTGNLGSAANVTLGENITANSLSFTNTGNSYTVVVGGNTLTLTTGNVTNSISTSLSVAIDGTNGLTKKAFGTLRLFGANLYTGNTVIEGGILEARSNVALPASTVVVIGSGSNNAFLDLRANPIIAGINSGTSGVATVRTTSSSAATQTLTINPDGASSPADSTFSGVLTEFGASNVLALTKAGSEILTLTGDSTYTGATNVTGGALIIDGDNSGATGAVTVVGAGTVLGGSGIIGGNTTINAGAVLSPGNSPGELTFSSNLSLIGASFLDFEGGDSVVVDGSLSLSSGWTLRFGTGFQNGGSTTIFTYGTAGTFGADYLDAARIDATGLGFAPGSLSLSDNGSSIILDGISVIPEPSISALLAATFIALLILQRSRARQAA